LFKKELKQFTLTYDSMIFKVSNPMKIFIKAKPSSKKESITETEENHFTVAVKAPPRDGKANHAIVEALAEHFHISLSHVRLISGFSSREKVFEIL